jgi:hypothetical protein
MSPFLAESDPAVVKRARFRGLGHMASVPEIPENFQGYLYYDAIAGDLAANGSEATIAGTCLIYRGG